MSEDSPLVMPYGVRERLVGSPGDNVIVVKRVGHTKYIGGAVLGIVVNPFRGQVASAARLKVEPENRHIFILRGWLRSPPHQGEPTKEDPDV
jgi:hypothetical protein